VNKSPLECICDVSTVSFDTPIYCEAITLTSDMSVYHESQIFDKVKGFIDPI